MERWVKTKCHNKWCGCLIDLILTRMDLLIRRKSMPCAKTFHKVAGRVDAPVKAEADQEVKVEADLAVDDPAGRVEDAQEVKVEADVAEADLAVREVKVAVVVRYLSLDRFFSNYFFAPARIHLFIVSISCALNIGPFGGMGSFLSVRRSVRRLNSGFFLSTTVERL